MRFAFLTIGALIAQLSLAFGQQPSDASLSAFAWSKTQLHQGFIDFNKHCGGGLKDWASPHWNDPCRTITGDQLAELIRALPPETPLAQSVVQIVGVHTLGDLDLRGAELFRPLLLQQGRFEGALLLSDGHFQRSLTLSELFIAKEVNAQNIHADNGFALEKSQIDGVVDFGHAKVEGEAVMTGSRFLTDLNLDSASISGSLLLDNAHLSGRLLMSNKSEVRNSGAQIGQSAFFDHTRFDQAILGNEVRVGQDLDLTSAICGEVWLVAAKTDSFLKMTETTFNGIVHASNARVGQSLLAGNAMFHSAVYLDATTTSANMSLDHATFEKSFIGTSLDVRGKLTAKSAHFGEKVDLSTGRVGLAIEMGGASFAQTLDAPDLTVQGRFDLSNISMTGDLHLARSRVGDSLDLHGSQFSGVVDLTSMTVGHGLTLVGFDKGLATTPITWTASDPSKSVFFLLNAHVGELIDDVRGWPRTLQYYLNGLTYDKLVPWHSSQQEKWLDRSKWLDRATGDYSPQPYRQMAQFLTTTGERDAALNVQFHGRQQERKQACSKGNWSRCVSLSILEFTIGYGIGGFAFRDLLWIIALFVLGWLIIFRSPVARGNGLIWCAGASLDRLLPVVELNPEFKDFFKDPQRERLQSWQMFAFALIALLGWMLSLFLVAALTGLTQNV